ncbi:RNA-binding domain-containing protein [Peptostreptococcus anaerobius]|uniref:RNA-binding domain-containing protein n=1 Tax=Peptostreptococcus anaerobius TaxID=1261 RepID=UPI002551A070|nr:RNA-binding domain-containing protein [Peptostreptococcus anaerobius]MDK8278296.1 putative DNA binding domain-containing protein [Peptostreptococcus anaerobius]
MSIPNINKIITVLEEEPQILKESSIFEFKKAKTKFPQDALTTYSSFANTEGGFLILGVTENEDLTFDISGIENIDSVIDDLFKNLHNPTVVSKNILTNRNLYQRKVNEKDILIIHIPEADYRSKPIHLKENKYNSYIRCGTGDYKCSKEQVESMIVEAYPTAFDSTIAKNFTLDDLDMETINKYRFRFNEYNIDHPFSSYQLERFLISIGAASIDREGDSNIHPTIAGLLLLGKYQSIRDLLPYYHIEYIDKRFEFSVDRWNDRLIYDGTWGEGNLYNFFFETINKLRNTLENKFELGKDKLSRIDDGEMFVAVREAFVNSIIHCDFKNSHGIKIIRNSDSFIFENGGTLRISRLDFFAGGKSDPRNNHIQDMFRFIKLCERAGTGIPKIMQVVDKYSLKRPLLDTKENIIKITLWDSSLSDNAIDLNESEKTLLNYICVNKMVTRKEIQEYFDISKSVAARRLKSLTDKNYIQMIGESKSTQYTVKKDIDFIKYEMAQMLLDMI